jgi:hypothetical protein
MAYLDQYQTFQTALSHVHQDLTPEPTLAKRHLTDLQRIFQETIAAIDLTDIPPPANHRLQSLQVEIAKELRLLQVDVLFLQTAKQAETVAHRHLQIQGRLGTLARYCAIVLTPETPETPKP